METNIRSAWTASSGVIRATVGSGAGAASVVRNRERGCSERGGAASWAAPRAQPPPRSGVPGGRAAPRHVVGPPACSRAREETGEPGEAAWGWGWSPLGASLGGVVAVLSVRGGQDPAGSQWALCQKMPCCALYACLYLVAFTRMGV